MMESNSFARAVALLFTFCGVYFTSLREASADQIVSVVHIICAPEVGYFSLRRFSLVNPPYESDDKAKPLWAHIASQHGIYSPLILKSSPFECDLLIGAATPDHPEQKRKVKVRAEVDLGSLDKTAASHDIPTRVVVSADAKPFAGIFLGSIAWGPATIDLIEVIYNGADLWVRKCSYGEYPQRPSNKGTCTDEKL